MEGGRGRDTKIETIIWTGRQRQTDRERQGRREGGRE